MLTIKTTHRELFTAIQNLLNPEIEHPHTSDGAGAAGAGASADFGGGAAEGFEHRRSSSTSTAGADDMDFSLAQTLQASFDNAPENTGEDAAAREARKQENEINIMTLVFQGSSNDEEQALATCLAIMLDSQCIPRSNLAGALAMLADNAGITLTLIEQLKATVEEQPAPPQGKLKAGFAKFKSHFPGKSSAAAAQEPQTVDSLELPRFTAEHVARLHSEQVAFAEIQTQLFAIIAHFLAPLESITTGNQAQWLSILANPYFHGEANLKTLLEKFPQIQVAAKQLHDSDNTAWAHFSTELEKTNPTASTFFEGAFFSDQLQVATDLALEQQLAAAMQEEARKATQIAQQKTTAEANAEARDDDAAAESTPKHQETAPSSDDEAAAATPEQASSSSSAPESPDSENDAQAAASHIPNVTSSMSIRDMHYAGRSFEGEVQGSIFVLIRGLLSTLPNIDSANQTDWINVLANPYFIAKTQATTKEQKEKQVNLEQLLDTFPAIQENISDLCAHNSPIWQSFLSQLAEHNPTAAIHFLKHEMARHLDHYDGAPTLERTASKPLPSAARYHRVTGRFSAQGWESNITHIIENFSALRQQHPQAFMKALISAQPFKHHQARTAVADLRNTNRDIVREFEGLIAVEEAKAAAQPKQSDVTADGAGGEPADTEVEMVNPRTDELRTALAEHFRLPSVATLPVLSQAAAAGADEDAPLPVFTLDDLTAAPETEYNPAKPSLYSRVKNVDHRSLDVHPTFILQIVDACSPSPEMRLATLLELIGHHPTLRAKLFPRLEQSAGATTLPTELASIFADAAAWRKLDVALYTKTLGAMLAHANLQGKAKTHPAVLVQLNFPMQLLHVKASQEEAYDLARAFKEVVSSIARLPESLLAEEIKNYKARVAKTKRPENYKKAIERELKHQLRADALQDFCPQFTKHTPYLFKQLQLEELPRNCMTPYTNILLDRWQELAKPENHLLTSEILAILPPDMKILLYCLALKKRYKGHISHQPTLQPAFEQFLQIAKNAVSTDQAALRKMVGVFVESEIAHGRNAAYISQHDEKIAQDIFDKNISKYADDPTSRNRINLFLGLFGSVQHLTADTLKKLRLTDDDPPKLIADFCDYISRNTKALLQQSGVVDRLPKAYQYALYCSALLRLDKLHSTDHLAFIQLIDKQTTVAKQGQKDILLRMMPYINVQLDKLKKHPEQSRPKYFSLLMLPLLIKMIVYRNEHEPDFDAMLEQFYGAVQDMCTQGERWKLGKSYEQLYLQNWHSEDTKVSVELAPVISFDCPLGSPETLLFELAPMMVFFNTLPSNTSYFSELNDFIDSLIGQHWQNIAKHHLSRASSPIHRMPGEVAGWLYCKALQYQVEHAAEIQAAEDSDQFSRTTYTTFINQLSALAHKKTATPADVFKPFAEHEVHAGRSIDVLTAHCPDLKSALYEKMHEECQSNAERVQLYRQFFGGLQSISLEDLQHVIQLRGRGEQAHCAELAQELVQNPLSSTQDFLACLPVSVQYGVFCESLLLEENQSLDVLTSIQALEKNKPSIEKLSIERKITGYVDAKGDAWQASSEFQKICRAMADIKEAIEPTHELHPVFEQLTKLFPAPVKAALAHAASTDTRRPSGAGDGSRRRSGQGTHTQMAELLGMTCGNGKPNAYAPAARPSQAVTDGAGGTALRGNRRRSGGVVIADAALKAMQREAERRAALDSATQAAVVEEENTAPTPN